MPKDLADGLIVGVSIGLTVILVRSLTHDFFQYQQLAIALALVVVCAVQLALVVRRPSRREGHKRAPNTSDHAAINQAHNDPFAHELNHDWTGLRGPTAAQDHQGHPLRDALGTSTTPGHPSPPATDPVHTDRSPPPDEPSP